MHAKSQESAKKTEQTLNQWPPGPPPTSPSGNDTYAQAQILCPRFSLASSHCLVGYVADEGRPEHEVVVTVEDEWVSHTNRESMVVY
jgi:hypothetical protein